jgi:hypothetical protein
MIEYDELCAALERYAARTGGQAPSTRPPTAPQPSPARAAKVAASRAPEPAPRRLEATKETALPPLSHHDEPHDPDFPTLSAHHDEDSTQVGGVPVVRPRGIEEHSNEIDLGDVLSDDEL